MGLPELKAAYQERRWLDAIQEYQDLAEPGPEAHFYAGLAYRADGQLIPARRALAAGMDAQPANRMRLQILLTLGEVWRELGDYPVAIELLERFIAEVEAEPDLASITLGCAWHNLGLAYRQARRLNDSVVAYVKACVYHRREGMHHMLMESLHNLAWVYCLQGDAQPATEALDEAEGLCGSEDDRAHQTLGRAFAALVAHDFTGARRLYSDLFETAKADDVLSHAYLLAGRSAQAQGDLEEARQFALTALHHGELARSADNRCWRDASDLLQEVENAQRRAANQ